MRLIISVHRYPTLKAAVHYTILFTSVGAQIFYSINVLQLYLICLHTHSQDIYKQYIHLLVSHSGVLLSIASSAFPIQIIFPILKSHWINNLLRRYQWAWFLGLRLKAYKFLKHPASRIWKCSSQWLFGLTHTS